MAMPMAMAVQMADERLDGPYDSSQAHAILHRGLLTTDPPDRS